MNDLSGVSRNWHRPRTARQPNRPTKLLIVGSSPTTAHLLSMSTVPLADDIGTVRIKTKMGPEKGCGIVIKPRPGQDRSMLTILQALGGHGDKPAFCAGGKTESQAKGLSEYSGPFRLADLTCAQAVGPMRGRAIQ